MKQVKNKGKFKKTFTEWTKAWDNVWKNKLNMREMSFITRKVWKAYNRN